MSGGVVPFEVRSPDGRAGWIVMHNECVLRTMHPSVRALLDTAPILSPDERPEEIEYVIAEHHGTLAVTVSMYPPEGLDPGSPAVHEFFADARERLEQGMAMAGGPHKQQEIPPGMTVPAVPLVTFYFGPEHVPSPMWEIREWLLSHPLARLIEVESHAPDAQAT